MNFFDKLLKQYYGNQKKYKRKIGRYWATDLYNIITNELTPENFFQEKKYNLETLRKFYRGEMVEEAICKILKTSEHKIKYQKKDELKIDDFVIVVKPDLITENRVIDIKSTIDDNITQIKPYHCPQIACYSEFYRLPTYLLYLNPLTMQLRSFRYKPNKEYWEFIKETITKFHKKLCQITIAREAKLKEK